LVWVEIRPLTRPLNLTLNLTTWVGILLHVHRLLLLHVHGLVYFYMYMGWYTFTCTWVGILLHVHGWLLGLDSSYRTSMKRYARLPGSFNLAL